jgi:ankyrin repeat protein
MALLERDADINAIDSNGDTPMHLAVKVDSEPGRKCVATLLDISNHSGQRPFHIASNELVQKKLEERGKGIVQDLQSLPL